jgi:hypothetical protein
MLLEGAEYMWWVMVIAGIGFAFRWLDKSFTPKVVPVKRPVRYENHIIDQDGTIVYTKSIKIKV